MKMSKLKIVALAAIVASLTAFTPKVFKTASKAAKPGDYYAYVGGGWTDVGTALVICEDTNTDPCSAIEDASGNLVILAYGGPALVIAE